MVEKQIILCASTDLGMTDEDMPSSVRIAASCGHEVWVSQAGMQVHLGMGAKLMCTECGMKAMRDKGEHTAVAIPGAMAEIEAVHGKEAREASEQLAKLLGIETFG